MSIYVTRDNCFEQQETAVRECPHCGAQAQLVPVATPSFEALTQTRPRHAGIVFQCANCQEPRFARVATRSFGPDRVVLSANLVEVERPKERFQYNYLPENVAPLFREALDTYTADLYTAFGVMCRRAVQAAIADSGSDGAPKLPDLYREVSEIAEIDYDTMRLLETLLFAPDVPEPALGPEQAAVLIEVIKDLFYQRYVRRAKLRAAVRMRRFFASEGNPNVTPIAALGRRAG